MDVRRLRFLLELSRHGSMRAVAEHLGTTTSTVSQQLAALAREVGTPLLEPEGRMVRLTPAGRRLAEHAVTILAAVDAARDDLGADAEPAGEVRVAGFLTAIRTLVIPCVRELARTHPAVRVRVYEQEPAEALARLADDAADLALTYDYNLAPAPADDAFETRPLWTTPWALGVPEGAATGETALGAFRDHDWIGNSRNRADEQVITVLAAMAGFRPRMTHQCDNLDLVEDLIVAGMGVGLLPADRPARPGVTLLPLARPEVRLRAYLTTRRGRSGWAPLALLRTSLLRRNAGGER
jgi:DNA-binding transcriptional LysR family regulator